MCVCLSDQDSQMNAAALAVRQTLQQRPDGIANVLLVSPLECWHSNAYQGAWLRSYLASRSIGGGYESLCFSFAFGGVSSCVALGWIEEEGCRISSGGVDAISICCKVEESKKSEDPEIGGPRAVIACSDSLRALITRAEQYAWFPPHCDQGQGTLETLIAGEALEAPINPNGSTLEPSAIEI